MCAGFLVLLSFLFAQEGAVSPEPTGMTEQGASQVQSTEDAADVIEPDDSELSADQPAPPPPPPRPRPQPAEEQSSVRRNTPVQSASPELLDAWDDDFIHRRVAGYELHERGQIAATVDEPVLQDGAVLPEDRLDDSDGDNNKNVAFLFKGNLTDLVAWLSIILILVFIIVLYVMRNGKHQRKVFRNIPSKKRSFRNNYNKYNRY